MKEFIVKDDEVGKRIDSYLSNKDDEISRVAVQRLIKNDKMALNWQTPTSVIEYIRNNLEKIGTVSFFDIYEP